MDTVSKKVEVSSYLFKGTRVERELVPLGQGNGILIQQLISTYTNHIWKSLITNRSIRGARRKTKQRGQPSKKGNADLEKGQISLPVTF